MNDAPQYQNGIDFHVDWAASKFLTKNLQIGIAGYYLHQLTADSGAGARLGDFKGRVFGIGPQVGFIIPISDGYQGYLNLKAYKDIGAENRPEGCTAWVTSSRCRTRHRNMQHRRRRCTGNNVHEFCAW